MAEILGDADGLGWVMAKAALLFLTAVVALRVARRRTVAQMTPVDFVAAVAVGAIVGRVPNSTTTSFVQGATTLLTILVVHSVVTRAARFRTVERLVQHPPLVLVAHGRLDEQHLLRAGLTHDDVFAVLREKGAVSLDDVQYLIYEARGRFSLVAADRDLTDATLLTPIIDVRRGLRGGSGPSG